MLKYLSAHFEQCELCGCETFTRASHRLGYLRYGKFARALTHTNTHTHVLGSATTAATAPHCHCPNRKPLANNCSARSGSENETPGLCVAQAKPQHTESQAIATFAYLLRVMCVKCIDSYVKRVVIARTFLVVGIRAFRDGVEHVAQTPLYAVRWFWRTQAHTQPCLLYANMRRIR